jgi:hypothetical protein
LELKRKNNITEVKQAPHENLSLMLITKAELDMKITTAKAFPRSLAVFMDKALSMATINEDIAASCSYALPRAGKTIEGPSVRLAEIVCAAYGNICSGARVIDNDGKTITAQGICHDLETNNSVTVEVKRRILDKYGKTMSEDMQVVIGNAACAIAYRNAVYKVVPAAFIDDIYEKTKEVARGTAETLIKKREKALTHFRNLGVKDDQICEVLNIKKIDDIDIDKLSVLRGFVSAVKDGEATIQEIFAPKSSEEKPDKKEARTIAIINSATTLDQLNKVRKDCTTAATKSALLDKETEIEANATTTTN